MDHYPQHPGLISDVIRQLAPAQHIPGLPTAPQIHKRLVGKLPPGWRVVTETHLFVSDPLPFFVCLFKPSLEDHSNIFSVVIPHINFISSNSASAGVPKLIRNSVTHRNIPTPPGYVNTFNYTIHPVIHHFFPCNKLSHLHTCLESPSNPICTALRHICFISCPLLQSINMSLPFPFSVTAWASQCSSLLALGKLFSIPIPNFFSPPLTICLHQLSHPPLANNSFISHFDRSNYITCHLLPSTLTTESYQACLHPLSRSINNIVEQFIRTLTAPTSKGVQQLILSFCPLVPTKIAVSQARSGNTIHRFPFFPVSLYNHKTTAFTQLHNPVPGYHGLEPAFKSSLSKSFCMPGTRCFSTGLYPSCTQLILIKTSHHV
ncbi:hypothetical protein VP01_6310g1 [Puccinia sorghi]|uniref:Uncharacterized protein n=1 Tax=Puccinia sorghi TaxID=27349 RepID=A0A0L6UGA2_9BASI|nr:hypothetical protein VP01_6310g1 [Puccinia sorghi]